MAESGLPGYEAYAWAGMLGPAKMPATVVAAVDSKLQGILARPDVRERILKIGAETAYLGPEKFAAMAKKEIDLLTDIAKKAGIKAE